MALKVLLLNPPFKRGRSYNREGRCTQETDFWATPWPPYSLASIAAYIRADHEVRVLDCPAQNIGGEKLAEFVAAWRPDMIVSSSGTQTIDSDLSILQDLKTAYQLKTAVFGIHATVFSKQLLSAYDMDFIIRNEPEETAKQLLSSIEQNGDLSSVAGLAFVNENKQVIVTDDRPFIKDLDALPYPAWDLVDLDKYRLPIYDRKFLIVNAIRGCPFACSFCNAHVYYGSRARLRSVPSLIDEIKYCLQRYGIRDIFFWGDTFTLVREKVKALCLKVIEEDLGISWVANSRVDTVDKEILDLMRKAGCWMVSYGIESGDEAILKRCGKGITRDRVIEAVKLSKDAGIKVAGHFILGLPGETEESARGTLRFARQLDLDFANFYSAVPVPGSALYDEASEQGWINNKTWEQFSQSEFVMDLPTIAASRLHKLKRKAYLSSYLRPKNVGFAADFFRHRVLGHFLKKSVKRKDST